MGFRVWVGIVLGVIFVSLSCRSTPGRTRGRPADKETKEFFRSPQPRRDITDDQRHRPVGHGDGVTSLRRADRILQQAGLKRLNATFSSLGQGTDPSGGPGR